jgi:release factor glutamine methyltransferase
VTRTIDAVLRAATARLRDAGVPDPARDARRLLAAALQVETGRLTVMAQDPVPALTGPFDRWIAARACRQPVAQILGGREFYGRWIMVTPDVLDPRPETETLVELALSQPFSTVLDLGTGSGCILMTLLAERPEARGAGTDISPAALAVADRNAQILAVTDRVRLLRSDWFAAVEGRFDLIVSNPPYIAADEMDDLAPEVRQHEPRQALTDDGDGLAAYRAIARDAGRHLAPGGRLLVEIGPTQGDEVAAIFHSAGLEEVARHPDLDGRTRVIEAQAAGKLPEKSAKSRK